MRHFRDDCSVLALGRKFNDVLINQYLDDDTIMVAPSSTIINGSITTAPGFDIDIYQLSNGQIVVSNVTSSLLTWTFCTWVNVSSSAIYTLLDIEDNFQIIADTANDNLQLRRKILSGVYETVTLPITIELDTFVFLSVVRDRNRIRLYKNLQLVSEISDYFYNIEGTSVLFGKNFTGKLAGTVFYQKVGDFPGTFTEIECFKKPHNLYTPYSAQIEKQVIDLHDVDVVSTSKIYPVLKTHTKYFPELKAWQVSRATVTTPITSGVNGLCVAQPSVSKLQTFSIEVGFDCNSDTNSVIVSQKSVNTQWFFWYEKTTNNVYFSYFNKISNTLQTVLLGQKLSNQINYVALSVNDSTLLVYFNGQVRYSITYALRLAATFRFNFDVPTVPATGMFIYVYKFTVSKLALPSSGYLPYLHQRKQTRLSIASSPYNYHFDRKYAVEYKPLDVFVVSGTFNIAPGGSRTYTITFLNVVPYSRTIIITPVLLEKTDLLLSEVAVTAQVTVAPNQLTAQFVVSVTNFSPNKFKNGFYVSINGFNYSQKIFIDIVDSRQDSLSYITSLNGYADGYLVKDSTTPGILPNLSNNANALTTAERVTTLHGTAYQLSGIDDYIQYPNRTARTLFLVYRELDLEPNRGYFGSTEHTFNGGTNGELVGSLVFTPGEYVKAFSLNRKAIKTVISANDNTLVCIDEQTYAVAVYEKTSQWNTVPTELVLGLDTPESMVDASVSINASGNVIALGFKNANSGEGVVQIWRKTSGVWVKELHLGSPTPSPYLGAFGHSVAVDNAGTRLFASQIGSNTVYVFEKSSLWSATPVETLIGSNRFGFVISCNGAGDKLFVNEVDESVSHIFELGATWSSTASINFGINGSFSENGNFLVISNHTTGTVRLYETGILIKTLTGTHDFGYAVSVSNSGDIAVGTPSIGKISIYVNSDNYTTSTEYTGVAGDFYGYSVSRNNNSIAASNYQNLVELITNNTTALPSSILNTRQNYQNTSNTADLYKKEPNILVFSTATSMSVSNIGKTKSNCSLNGLVYGWLIFNRILTSEETSNIENLLRRVLSFNTYSTYDT